MERRQLTLMFTDIVGYSCLMGQNEDQAIALLGEYRRILLAQIKQNQGTVIEFIGDAIFARFETPYVAVQAGINSQKDLAAFNQNRESTLPRLQSRIGIHQGEVTLKDQALFGEDVNIAARLEPLAVAGGLCISENVYSAVCDTLTEPVLFLGMQPLKNIEGKVRVYLVRPDGISVAVYLHYLLRKFQQKISAYRYPLVIAVIMLIVAGFYFIPRWLVPGYTANYVEIEDFKNLMTQDGGADYFSAGITEALRSQLADIRNVYILTANKGVRGPVRLEGSVQKIEDRVRIVYQLFRRKGNVQIAGGKLDGTYSDIFILQDRVVAEIAGYLAEEFDLDNYRPAAHKLTSDVTAYDYYLQGLAFLRKPKSHESFDRAITLLSTALVHDANFALANAGLCRAYWEKYDLTRTTSWVSKAEAYCLQAMERDDSLSEVYEALGVIYRDTGRQNEAVKILKKAIALDSNNVSAIIALGNVYRLQNNEELAEHTFRKAILTQSSYWEGYQELASFFLHCGRLNEAVDQYQRVLEITPENIFAYSNLGVAYFYLGNYKKAAEALRRSVSLSPTSTGYSNTGTMYYFSGDYMQAIRMFKDALRLAPEDFRLYANLGDVLRQIPHRKSEAEALYQKTIGLALLALQVNAKDPQIYQYLAMSYLFTNQKKKAENFLNDAFLLSPGDVSMYYTKVKFWSAMKEPSKALDAFAELMGVGYAQSLIEADPGLKELRSHPDYQNILLKKQGE